MHDTDADLVTSAMRRSFAGDFSTFIAEDGHIIGLQRFGKEVVRHVLFSFFFHSDFKLLKREERLLKRGRESVALVVPCLNITMKKWHHIPYVAI